MIADFMFSLNFLPGHLQQVGDAGSVRFPHDSVMWKSHWGGGALIGFDCTDFDSHGVFIEFLPGHLQQVGDAGSGSVGFPHDSVVWKSHWDGGALIGFDCTDFDSHGVFIEFLPGHLQQVGDAGSGSVGFPHDSVVWKSHWDGGALIGFDCTDFDSHGVFIEFLPGHLQQVGDAGSGSVRSSHDSIVGKSHWGGGALHRLWFTCYKLLCSFSRTVDTHTHISYTFWLAMSCELLAQNKMLQTCPIINASKWTEGFPQNQNQTQWFGHHWTIKMMFKHHQTFEHHQNHSGLQKHQHHAVVYHYKSSWCSISATSQANQKVQSKWDLSISQVDQRSSEYPLVNSVNERDLNLLNTYM